MNKERYNQIIDDAYENYKTIHKHFIRTDGDRSQLVIESLEKQLIYTQEEFIIKCKTYPDFMKNWGLKIEERELSTQERNEWFQIHLNGNNPFMKSDWKDFELDQQNIPTKQITLEYNNEKTYYYE